MENSSNLQQSAVLPNSNTKKTQIGKILIGLGSILLLGVTLFIGYRFFLNKPVSMNDNQIAEIPTATLQQVTTFPTAASLPTSTPTRTVTAVVSPLPSPIGTLVPSPTQKIPTPTGILIPTSSGTNLPSAGNSLPTLLTAFFGTLLSVVSTYLYLAS